MNDKIAEKMLENDQFRKRDFNNPASIVTKFSGDATIDIAQKKNRSR